MLSSTAWCPKQKCNPENSSFVFIWKFFDVLQEIWDEFDLNTNTDEKKNTHRDLLSPSHWVGFDNEYRIEYKMRYVICLRCIFFCYMDGAMCTLYPDVVSPSNWKTLHAIVSTDEIFGTWKLWKCHCEEILKRKAPHIQAQRNVCCSIPIHTFTFTIKITLSQFNGWKRERFEI